MLQSCRDVTTYSQLVKILSSVGFVYEREVHCWKREKDGAVLSDSTLLDVCGSWHQMIPFLASGFVLGAKGYTITPAEADNGDFTFKLEFQR